MTKPDLMAMAAQERAELLALLRGLTEDQWNAPSLCTRWRVRDVAAHVVSYDELSALATVGIFLRGGLRPGRVNDVALDRYRDLTPSDIVDLLARNQRPSGLPAGFGGGIAMTDGTIHHQDIRRALGMQRTIPQDRLTAVLDFSLAAPTLPSKRNRRRLRLVATDIGWSSGDGDEVTGPGEALLMAVAGRPHALSELGGDGLPTLRKRINTRLTNLPGEYT
ncbi:MAG: hypothetical protein K0Q93_3224 [Nocardioidaceae bacterium]|jgi:uncharacterized protein (TIGR03083 family)|nr:hypothetical protein [Nocardioidaceae bacterium]